MRLFHLSAALLLIAPATRADEARTSSLGWVRLEGAEHCLAASALAEAVEKRLGRKVFLSASEADLNIEGSIGPRGEQPGYRATLRLTDRQGEALGTREVETSSPECADIDEKLALVVSVMIDPDAAARPEPAKPEPAKPAPRPPPVVKTKIVEKERIVVVPASEPEPLRWEIAAGVLGTLGVQPGVGLSFAPAFVLELPGLFGLVAEGGVALQSSASTEDGRASADAAFMHGALSICPLVAHPWRLSILGCAGWLVGGLLSEGAGFDVDRAGTPVITGPWIAGRLTIVAVGPVGAVANLGLLAPITRAELYASSPEGEETLHETAPVAGMAGIALCVRMP